MAFRIIAGVLGAFFLFQGIQWLVSPESAAAGLGMPLLDGVGRSTQIGDLASFFLCVGGFALYGVARRRPAWLQASALLVGPAAATRTIAWAAHGAPFTAMFITIEIVAGALLFAASTRLGPAPQ